MLIRLSCLALFLLTACNPLLPQQLEPPQLPPSYRTSHQQTGAELPERWWEVFADDQLNRLQTEMLASNLDLRQAMYRLEQLEALRKTSAANLWPTLSLNAAASRDRTPGTTGSNISNSSKVSLAAGYEVDLWNRLHDAEKAAELQLQAGEKDVQTLLLSLTAQLAENYFLALEKSGQLKLVRQQLELNRQLLATASDRYRAGLATSDEIYQAQNNLLALEAQLPQLQTALNQYRQAIALLLGRYSADEFDNRLELPRIEAPIAVGLPASLLQKRPDIAAAFLQLQTVDHELAAAIAARLPTISLSASIGRSSTQLVNGDLEGALWSLAASLAQPLFDGGRRQAEVERQQAIRAEQFAALQQTMLNAVAEVQTALQAERNNAARVQHLVLQQQVSDQSLELSRNNYRSGLTASSDLLSAELQHLSIRSQLLSTRQELLSSRISLARALGGSWMAEELKQQQQSLTEDK